MSAVTLDQAKSWLSNIVKQNPTKVAKCNYATPNGDGTFDPDCILGVLLSTVFHLSPEYLNTLSSVFSAVYEEALPFVDFDPDALYFLCIVQGFQDGSACDQQNWQDAYDKGCQAVALVNAVGGSWDLGSLYTVEKALASRSL